MCYSLLSLRLNAVVCRHYDDYDISNLGSARAHRSKGLVARSVYEGDLPAVFLDHIRAYVLRDAARFSACYARVADIIKQACFAVIDVSHNGDDRRSSD